MRLIDLHYVPAPIPMLFLMEKLSMEELQVFRHVNVYRHSDIERKSTSYVVQSIPQ